MKIRKSEMDAMLGVMKLAENPEAFLSPEEFLKVLVGVLDEERGKREFFYGIVNTAGINAIAGPFSTRHQAEQMVEKTPAEKAWIVPGRTGEGWAQHLIEVDEQAKSKGDFAQVQADVLAFRRGWNGKSSTRRQYEGAS